MQLLGEKCNVKAECHPNGSRGPCSHSCESTNGTIYVNLTVSGDLDYEDQTQFILQVLVKNKDNCNFKKWNIVIEDVNEKPDKLELNGPMQISESTKSVDDFCFLMVCH